MEKLLSVTAPLALLHFLFWIKIARTMSWLIL